MTAVEWLFNKLWHTPKDKFTWYAILEQAKEMEREQHGKTWDSAIEQCEKRAWNLSRLYTDFDDYFAETYGSNGSDEHFEDNLDEIPTSSQTEISDEEIENFASDFYDNNGADEFIIIGAKWYREQLKNNNQNP